MAPDLAFRRSHLLSNLKRMLKHLLLLTVICGMLASGGLNFASITAVVFLFVLNASWQGSLAYFGVFLRPEDFIMLAKPDHFRDVVAVGVGEVRRFQALAATLVCSLIFSLVALALPLSVPYGNWTTLLAWAIIIGRAVQVAIKRRDGFLENVATIPGPIGALYSLAVAVAWQLAPVKPLPGSASYKTGKPQNATIAIIMGESINPARMDLFESGLNNTPNLFALSEETGPYRLIAKRGLSAGVASNASVTGLLSGSPFPWRTKGARTIFNLAKQQGFETSYWSAQTRSPVELLDGGRHIDSEHCWEHSPEDFARRKDWLLVDKLNAWPRALREFFFVYPRCNHAPYAEHNLGPIAQKAFNGTPSERLVHDYDLGMREFDKLVPDLLESFRTRSPGDLFVFITSDHNELLGNNGLTGHNLSDHAIGAFVPVMLYTNRPDHPVARAFQTMDFPNAFFLSTLVMSLMGIEAEIEPEPQQEVSYVCNSLPFGRSGYMRIREASEDTCKVDHFNRLGERTNSSTQALPKRGSVTSSRTNDRVATERSG
jgi:glucan phosphoethanolaminetransferase (alkaline phosphatase superfamily)